MPSYELLLVLRRMTRPETVTALKRAAESILDKGGIIRNMENLGTRALPYKISCHDAVHREGSYFTILFDTAPNNIEILKEEFIRDVDFVRRNIYRVEEEEKIECTLAEELLPPAYRKDVKEMLEISAKKQKKKFNYNSGLDYYPFQK
ncbi:probable 28S ribosomal protein S6, mitochondrial [Condylostylus longicornis]|uniref:probable 28S ribosomal protein S6, mitochondrial n=1 Tax=Condylostylus longicornis TaxID=2530218 RepID=UPI00244E21D7|nr:probable 28S ribosomal protein S6, mitochondrial [Condylostylus longicornis]